MPQLKKYGHWDVAEDGTLSLDGMSKFPVYGESGGILCGRYATWKLIDGKPVQGITDDLEILYEQTV